MLAFRFTGIEILGLELTAGDIKSAAAHVFGNPRHPRRLWCTSRKVDYADESDSIFEYRHFTNAFDVTLSTERTRTRRSPEAVPYAVHRDSWW